MTTHYTDNSTNTTGPAASVAPPLGPEALTPPVDQPPIAVIESNNNSRRNKILIAGGIAVTAVIATVSGLLAFRSSPEDSSPLPKKPDAAAPANKPGDLDKPSTTINSVKTTITVKQPEIDPSNTPLIAPASMKGSWPRDLVDEQGIGDFRMGGTIGDLNTFGYDTSKRHKDSQESYDVTDGNREIVVTVDSRAHNKIIAMRISSGDASTEEGIHVGSSKSDLENAYGSKLTTEEIITVDGTSEQSYVYISPRGQKFVFEVGSDNNVEAINIRSPKYF